MFDFSFDSILFVLTFWENLSNLNLEEKEEEIDNAINSSDLSNSFLLNQKEFLITKFSNDFYQRFLTIKNLTKNMKKLYSYLKQNINYEPNDINYIKKFRKDFKVSFLKKIMIKYENSSLIDNAFNINKNELINLIAFNSLTPEYIEIIEEIAKQYIFFKKNINQHQDYIKSNAPDFYNQFKKLISNSRKSYKKSLEKSLIYFALYLQDKLEKINMNFIFKKANNALEEKAKNEKIIEISNLSENTIQVIKKKLNTYKENFGSDITSLIGKVTNDKKNNEEIKKFSGKWKGRNDSIQLDIQNDVIEYSKKLEEKIPIDISIKNNDFEEKKKIYLF